MSLVLPFTQWPDMDRAMWHRLIRQGGPFDDRGALSHLRETSRAGLQIKYGRWLEWLRRTDPAALLEVAAERATVERLTAWLEALNQVRPMTRLAFFSGSMRVLRAAAPDANWQM